MPGIELRLSGPLFRSGFPTSVVQQVLRAAVQSIVELGEQRLDQMLRPRPAGVYLSVAQARKGQASTGHFRRNIVARVSGLTGRIDGGNVVYGPWLEGVSPRNQTTRFKGYASFRRTAQWLQTKAQEVLKRHAEHAVRQLNG